MAKPAKGATDPGVKFCYLIECFNFARFVW